MPKFFCMPFFACNRQVDSLDKRQCNLTTLPNDIERYSRTLEELLLDMNHIKELPRSLFRLHKLQRLGLSDNDVYRIPPEIALLTNLIELNVSRNDVSDIPDELKSCKMLRILDISSNPIARLPDSITQVTSLTHLNLNDTSLTKLPQDLGNLCNLKSLEVRENHLHNLPSTLSMLIHLQRLDVGQNELDELPKEISFLTSLQEFYCDENHLEEIPDGILKCKNLEQIDASSNKLMKLPENLGELEKLTDLTISQNCLQSLPSSIRHLKKLAILKADNNNLTSLTQAIGSCLSLMELYLMHNLLHELPSTICNLKKLETLNVDKNQLTTIPTLIGQCENLAVFSLRDNQIMEIPLEIGKLSNLRVLDLCNNQLRYLPFTINVLYKLQALWLSENQSQAMLKFQQVQDPQTQNRVLTCYLLPQQQGHVDHDKHASTSIKAFIGGPKVRFDGMEGDTTMDDEGGNGETGNFSRHDTPHPKPPISGQSGKQKKTSIDGHVIHHEGGSEHPKNIILSSSSRRSSEDKDKQPLLPPKQHHSQQQQHQNGPRSALKHPSVAQPFIESPTTDNGVSKVANDISKFSTTNSTSASASAAAVINGRKAVLFQTPNNNTPSTSKTGAANISSSDENNEPKLRRINTPHYKSLRGSDSSSSGTQWPKGTTHELPQISQQHQTTPLSIRQQQQQPTLITIPHPHQQPQHHQPLHQLDQSITTSTTSSIINPSCQMIQQYPQHQQQQHLELPLIIHQQKEIKKIVIERNYNSKGLGLTIAGGIESTPYIENDLGLFVSKLTSGGSAEISGLKVGDKLIEVNGVNMINQRHDVAVESMKKPTDIVTMVIERQTNNGVPSTQQLSQPPQQAYKGSTSTIPSRADSQATNSTSANQSFVTPNPPIKTLTSEIRSGASPSTSMSLETSILSASTSTNNNNNVISTHISKDLNGSPGFSISQPDGMDTVITAIKLGGAADRDGKLKIGDSILSINGQSCKGLTLNQISTQLTNPNIDTFVVLQRKSPQSSSSANNSTANVTLNGTNNATNIQLLPYGDISVDGIVDTVELKRDENNSLGLSIVGGIDHCSHPFGINNPGVFISKIAPNSPAALSGRLRIGDRILSVNKETVEKAKHIDAVTALKNSGKHLVLTIRHEPQPKGLREVIFLRRKNHPIGLNICGGINSPPANANDLTDEGIFIERIEKGSSADDCGRLMTGMRLLEINDDSLLGCTQIEAANIFRKSEGTIRLLVCDGFNINIIQENNSITPIKLSSDSPQSFSLLKTIPNESTPTKPTTINNGYVNINNNNNNGNNNNSQYPYRSANSTTYTVPIPTTTTKVSQILKDTSSPGYNLNNFSELPLASSSPIPVTSQTINNNGMTTTTTNGFNNHHHHRFSSSANNANSASPNISISNSNANANASTSFSNANFNNNNNSSGNNNNTIPLPPPSPITTFSTTTTSATTATTTTRPSGLPPPPVAPKPKPKVIPIESSPEAPENLKFSVKLRRFESEISSQHNPLTSATNGTKSTSALPSTNNANAPSPILPASSSTSAAINGNGNEFQQMNSSSSTTTNLPQIVRTKNAENRLAAAASPNPSSSPSPAAGVGENISGGEPLNSVEQHDLEIKKRAEWRQARLASLDAETQRADQLMKQLSVKRLGHISEERSLSSSPTANNRKVLHNESSIENFTTVDNTNGSKTVSIVETSVTQREFDLSSTLNDIQFADD